MKPLSIPILVLITAISTGIGAQLLSVLAARGLVLPLSGWLTSLVLLALIAVLLVKAIPLRRYMRESEERERTPTLAPRQHQIDLPTAFRIVLLARACAYTGAVIGGFFSGETIFLLGTGVGDLLTGVLPTVGAAVCGLALGILGVVVERWGTLPPQDGPGETSREGAGAES
ncbi:DUF3180 domain-containing protein [Brachybacterium sp. DNPG3]